MAKKIAHTYVDRSRADDYVRQAEEFGVTAAWAILQGHRNAAGLLLVHTAMCWADAICVRFGSVRSTSDRHGDAVSLLRQVAARIPGCGEAAGRYERILGEKSRVAYTGVALRAPDLKALHTNVQRFSQWALAAILRER